MMKEYKMDPTNQVENINLKIGEAIDKLRVYLSPDELYVVLYLVTLASENIFFVIHHDEDLNFDIKLPDYDFSVVKDPNQKEKIEDLYSIHSIFKQDLVKLFKNNLWPELYTIFQNFDANYLKENLADIFEYNLYRIAQIQGRAGGSHLLPLELSRFLSSLVSLQPLSSVYNPFAGFASFGIFLPETVSYFGQEIDEKVCAIGNLRLIAHGKNDLSLLLEGDSINDWAFENILANLENTDLFKKFDLIIANPPYGARLPIEIIGSFGTIRSFEHFLIEKGIDKLKNDGQLVALVSQGFLFRSGNEQNLRQYLIESDYLEKVILFPSGLLKNTGIPVVALVINKNKPEKGLVRFIDARSFCQKSSSQDKILIDDRLGYLIKSKEESEFIKIVPNKEVVSFEFNLNVPRYFQSEYEGKELRELGAFVRPARVIEDQIGNFIRIRDLKDDILDYQLNNKSSEILIPRQSLKIEESCLLIAGRWKTIKPTYFQYQGVPIYISQDILAFHIDESKCDITYLINELHSNYVSKQLEFLRIGEAIPRLRKEDLLSVKIHVPALDEQRIKVKKALSELTQERKQELLNKIKGLEGEIYEQNTYLRHTLAGPSSNLKDAIINIKKIILEKIATESPDVLNYKLSEKHLVTLSEYLDIVERDATKILSAVSSQLKVDTGIESKEITEVEIINFLERYSIENNERPNLNYQIKFAFDEAAFLDEEGKRIKTYILGNEDLLRDLFDNLIDNANKHAFTLKNLNRIEIYLKKNTENDDRDEVQILFSNTGKTFAEDFTFNDFIRKGSKIGINAGEGFGGWYINEIIKYLNGVFDKIEETIIEGLPKSDLATNFEINFPIIETDENGKL